MNRIFVLRDTITLRFLQYNLLKQKWIRSSHSKTTTIDLSNFTENNIRNFCIIAHIDHGKSTLADRLLEFTGTIPKDGSNKQVLDKLQVERERGITVKAQTSTMIYKAGSNYLLNLIDTPGHVDFSYEVSRSMAACQGALLVVDAAQGIQAQTVANFYNAIEANLSIIPVINKIDLASADISRVAKEIHNVFGFELEEMHKVSAKEGIGISGLLDDLCQLIPSPPGRVKDDLSLFLFDSWYDAYRGVICLMAVKGGVLRKGDVLQSVYSGEKFEVNDVGILQPDEVSTGVLYAGQVGYIVMGMRDIKQALIGDTFHHVNHPVKPSNIFKPPTPMVFGGVYPVDQSSYNNLNRAIQKLILNDSSVQVHPDNSIALGQGWRIGFLGLLHMDVFKQRLMQEHNADVIMTTPNVPYKADLKNGKSQIHIRSPEDFPEPFEVECFYEPTIIGTLIFPSEYIGKIISLCEMRRGEQLHISYIDESRVMLKYKLPLNEIVIDFYDQLKTVSSGFASFDYEEGDYEPANIQKMDILLNGKQVDALSTIVHSTKLVEVGKSYCHKLKNSIPRQLYEVVVQAAVRKRIIARETIKPVRKDVTAKCYGGDVTRKRKLLERQKEGKKKMKKFGNVEVPHEVFLSLLKK